MIKKNINQNASTANFLFQEMMPNNDQRKLILSKQQIERLRSITRDFSEKKISGERGQPRKDYSNKCTLVLFLSSNKDICASASSVIANELAHKLYRVDPSRVVNKYITETEKNLNRIFTDAHDSNAILLFDEADALFGGRKGEEDSHDREANKITDCFLRCLEAFKGAVILLANHRDTLDSVVVSRADYTLDFSNPFNLSTAKEDKPAAGDK